MYSGNYIKPDKRKKQNKFAKILIGFHAFITILFFLTFKLPIIPNEWLVNNLGTITCTTLSSLLFYYLLFCRGTRGKIILIESLKYHCNSLGQRIIVCGGIIGFCGIFYLLGRLFVPVIVAPATIINGEYEIHQAILERSSKGQRWYKGYTKLVFQFKHNNSEIEFYWPTNKAKKLIQGSVSNITSNKTWLGTHIMEIKKAD